MAGSVSRLVGEVGCGSWGRSLVAAGDTCSPFDQSPSRSQSERSALIHCPVFEVDET